MKIGDIIEWRDPTVKVPCHRPICGKTHTKRDSYLYIVTDPKDPASIGIVLYFCSDACRSQHQ